MEQKFNPGAHLATIKTKQGPAPYMKVSWRLVWFRTEHPHGTINTEIIHLDLEKNICVCRACVCDEQGGMATGIGSESAKDFPDYIEKSSTKAIGRALAALGFGTQFAGEELDEALRIVDSPVMRS